MFRKVPRRRPLATPVTEEGLKQYDDLHVITAIWRAWEEPGENPEWHKAMQEEVRRAMPLLARALDRLGN